MALKLMYITNRPEIAQIAETAGVDRIFVDLEYIGKKDRVSEEKAICVNTLAMVLVGIIFMTISAMTEHWIHTSNCCANI